MQWDIDIYAIKRKTLILQLQINLMKNGTN